MDKELDYLTRFALELILCALILGVCAAAGIAGRRAYESKLNKETEVANLKDFSTLYYYNDRIVTGNDIIELLMEHPKEYQYYVIIDGKSEDDLRQMQFTKASEKSYLNDIKNDYKGFWSEKRIRDAFKGYENLKFKANLVRVSGANDITGVQFVYINSV